MKIKSFICISLLIVFIHNAFAQHYDAEVIKYTTLCVADKEKTIQTDSVILQINNRAGDIYTEISLPYSKFERISNIVGWIETIDGIKIRELKSNEIIDKSAISNISLYEDNFKKCFQLKHNIYPYRIFYTCKTNCKNFLNIAWWTPVLFSAIPTKTATLRVVVPKNEKYNISTGNISSFRKDSTTNNIIYEWKSSYETPIKSEIYSQPQKYYPYVKMVPLNFTYGVEGSTADWKSFGNWQWRLNEGLDVLPENEKKTILELTKGTADKKEIIKILYHYLQDRTRYVNVSLGIGGYKTYPASYVSENKYGDCKALTNYMKAMLSFLNIESYYSLVHAGNQPEELIKNFAAPQFNHVILAVPFSKDTLWLENTNAINPFGYLGTFTQNREVLLVTNEKSRLVRTPGLKKEQTLSTRKLEYELSVNGKTKLMLKSIIKGKLFERYNALHSDYTNDIKDRFFRENMSFDNYEVVDWELNKPQRDSAWLAFNATLNLSKVLTPIGNEYYFSLAPASIPSFAIPANRKLPVELPYSICNEDTLIYKLPEGYELKTKPDSILISTDYGNYCIKWNTMNDKVYVFKKMEIFPGSYSLEEYPGFYSFIKSMKNIDTKKLVIKPKQ